MGLEANQFFERAKTCTLSPQILDEDPLSIQQDHGDRPLGAQERASIWRHTALSGVELFRGSYRKHEFARHFHSAPAIGVVDRGSMRSYCRSADHVLPVGTILLLNPGEVHAPGPIGTHGWSFRVFFFEDLLFHTRSAAVAGDTLRFSQPFVQDRLIADGLLRLHRNLEGPADRLDVESSLFAIMAQLAQRHGGATEPLLRLGKEKAKVNIVKDYVASHYARNIALDDLAALARCSPYYLLRTFRNAVGLTPHAYLTQIRVEAAKRFLQMGNAIIDVAGITGFVDQSHLTRHFKRITGVTPGQYLPSLRAQKI